MIPPPIITISGRTASGKSSLAYIIREALAKNNVPCLVQGLEDDRPAELARTVRERLSHITEIVRIHTVQETVRVAPPINQPSLRLADYEEVLADHRRLVRELNVILNGEEGAAKQVSLCDIVAQMRGRKTTVVCEVICQKPSVSVHFTEAAAFKHAVQCAMENLRDPDVLELEARAEFESTLTDYDRITEGDYEVHILTPSN